MGTPLAQMRAMAGGGAARGSAVDAATGLVGKNGNLLPPSASYLQAQEEAERHAKLDRAWRHYVGDLHGHFRQEAGQPDVNVLSNRAAPIVDTGVDFLYGKTVTLEVMKDGKPQPDAQKALDGCWGKDARRMTLLSKLAQNGGIFGHVFAKIIPPSDDRPFCRVVPLDPAQVTAVTDLEDCDTVKAYIIDWMQPDTRFREIQVGRRQIIVRKDPDDPDGADENNDAFSYDADATWEISNWLRGPNNQWFQLGEPIEWEHPWAPVVDWQNLPLANLHWGMSDIPGNVQHLNSVLNLTLSNINANAKYHGFPIVTAAGVDPGSQLNVGPGKVLKLASPDAKLNALEAYGDTAGLLNFAADLRADMDEQTRVPSVATGRLRDVPRVTSGVAFQMMYGPLLGKTAHKQRLYETGHEELSLRMLSLMGFGDGTGMDGWEVCTHWPSPLPNDDASTAQLALAMQQVGASKHAVYKVLGLDYDQEQEYLKDEAKEAMQAMLKGQAMPGMQPGQPGQQPPQQGGPQSGPPVNAPAAVAQRNATKAVAQAMRGGANTGS